MANDKAPALDVQKEDALDGPVHETAPAAADRGVSHTSSGSISGLSAPAQPVQMFKPFDLVKKLFGTNNKKEPSAPAPVSSDYTNSEGNLW